MITRVLVIDSDLSARRNLLRLLLPNRGSKGVRENDTEPGFEVVAQAGTLEEAVDAAISERPQLAILAVRSGGPSAAWVRSILSVWAVPVVLIGGGARTSPGVFEALAAGAVEQVELPPKDDPLAISVFRRMLKMMSQVKVRKPAPVVSFRLIAVASSTGGPSALRQFLAALPADLAAPVVVAQHISKGHEEGLVQWLAQDCPFPVKVADPVEHLMAGRVYVGPAERDIATEGPSLLVTRPASASSYHPSADALFTSVARVFRENGVAVILSGAGTDGLAGAAKMQRAGGTVLAQDELSSTVYGMPRAVAEAGVAAVVGTPQTLARAVCEALKWSVGR